MRCTKQTESNTIVNNKLFKRKKHILPGREKLNQKLSPNYIRKRTIRYLPKIAVADTKIMFLNGYDGMIIRITILASIVPTEKTKERRKRQFHHPWRWWGQKKTVERYPSKKLRNWITAMWLWGRHFLFPRLKTAKCENRRLSKINYSQISSHRKVTLYYKTKIIGTPNFRSVFRRQNLQATMGLHNNGF